MGCPARKAPRGNHFMQAPANATGKMEQEKEEPLHEIDPDDFLEEDLELEGGRPTGHSSYVGNILPAIASTEDPVGHEPPEEGVYPALERSLDSGEFGKLIAVCAFIIAFLLLLRALVG